MLSDMFDKDVLIFGCGNILMGDDGFGPAVIERLNRDYELPEGALALDVGTGIRELLFDLLLSEKRSQKIIIVDAVDRPGRKPGEVFEISVDEIPEQKAHDFSLHQFPTVNMLKELKDHTEVDIRILAAQVTSLPEEIRPGLSPAVAGAVDRACREILRKI